MTDDLTTRLKEAGRWIAVLPGGLLLGLSVLFPLHWILYFTLVKGDIIEMSVEDMAVVERFVSPIISSIVFVYGGAMIAPRKHILVAIVLFIAGIFIRAGLPFLLHIFDMELDTSFAGLSKLILSALAGGVGVLLVYARRKWQHINADVRTVAG